MLYYKQVRRRSSASGLERPSAGEVSAARTRSLNGNGVIDEGPAKQWRRSSRREATFAALASLGLAKQNALLLLRTCLQHNTAHLLRTIDLNGDSLRGDRLHNVWKAHDRDVARALAEIRGSPPRHHATVLRIDDTVHAHIRALPEQLGGIGLLSHTERMQIALDGAREGDSDACPSTPPTKQHDRHKVNY